MKRFTIVALALVLGAGSYTLICHQANDGAYATDWENALWQARSEAKPILLSFGGPW